MIGEVAAQTIGVAELRVWAAVDTASPMLGAALDLALGHPGKGIRPTLVFAAARFGPYPTTPEVRQAAVAVELLHLATLVHDDVIDQPESRRGAPTVASVHGNHAAAATGTWLLSRFHDLVAACGREALRHASDAAMRLCEGQMLDARELFNTDRSVERYLAAVEGKTAALFELSARLGGLLGHADGETTACLASFGRHLGVAYQIADDVMDVCDLEGGDLRFGNYTLPVLHAIEADPGLAAQLADPDRVPAIAVSARTHDVLAEQIARAREAIAGLPDTATLDALVDLVERRGEGAR